MKIKFELFETNETVRMLILLHMFIKTKELKNKTELSSEYSNYNKLQTLLSTGTISLSRIIVILNKGRNKICACLP